MVLVSDSVLSCVVKCSFIVFITDNEYVYWYSTCYFRIAGKLLKISKHSNGLSFSRICVGVVRQKEKENET